MSPVRAKTRRSGRPAQRGNALIEFVLTLPIIFFLLGLAMYMSMAMLARHKALIGARHALWQSAGHGQWTDMKLEGHVPGANQDDGTHRPRGTGEDLDRLRPEVEPDTLAKTSNLVAHDYWSRLWDNLPGRHESEASRSFETEGRMWDFLAKTATADHFRDSSPWHFQHIDAWRIARSGPLREIFEAFRDNLDSVVAPHFEPTRKDIQTRWWHAGDVYDDPFDPGN